MLRKLYRLVRSRLLHSVVPESRVLPFANGKTGIEVVSVFSDLSGLGESARLCAEQLHKEGYKVRCTSIEHFLFKKEKRTWKFEDTAAEDEIGLRILRLNPAMIPPYAIGIGLRKFASLYNIGYWAWELEKLPREWMKALRYINAVMVPSVFTAEVMRRYTGKPVLTAAHPVFAGPASTDIRQRMGLKDSDFVICNIFSMRSAVERKNPQGLIEAFLKSFGETKDAYLVFKISQNEEGKQILKDMGRNHPNIVIIDEVWPQEDVFGLIKTSSVYASLHRSEGFGLSLAEAMVLGTPVVATHWSGNVDFCTERNSFCVGYTMVPVDSGHAEFADVGGALWPEPDVDQAAAILRGIYENPVEARQKAQICLNETNVYFNEPRYRAALDTLTASI